MTSLSATTLLTSDALITLPCRHGVMSILRNDEVIGRCLQKYGEWAEAELTFLLPFVPDGGCIVDVGANIGTHCLPFSRHVSPAGRVLAFEPQPFIYNILLHNLARNSITNVDAYNVALGSSPGAMFLPALDYSSAHNFAGVKLTDENTTPDGHRISVDTLDTYALSVCDLIKIDVESMESQVIAGARDTLLRLRPVVYAECSSVVAGWPLLEALHAADYVCRMHLAPAFNPDNYFGDPDSIYGIACESNLLAVPTEKIAAFAALLENNPRLIPVGTLDDLARAVFDTPRWGDPNLERYSRWGLLSRIVRQQEDLERLRSTATRVGEEQAAPEAAAKRESELHHIIAEKESALVTAGAALEASAARESDLHRIVAAKEAALVTADSALEASAARESDLHRIVAAKEAALVTANTALEASTTCESELHRIVAVKEAALATADSALIASAARESELHSIVAAKEAALATADSALEASTTRESELHRIVAAKEAALATADSALEASAVRETEMQHVVAEQGQDLAESKRTGAQLTTRLSQQRLELAALRSERRNLVRQLDECAKESDAARAAADARIGTLVDGIDHLQRRIEDLLQSRSWKWTTPLRAVWSVLRKP